MVLQSILQYRAFGSPEAIERYQRKHDEYIKRQGNDVAPPVEKQTPPSEDAAQRPRQNETLAHTTTGQSSPTSSHSNEMHEDEADEEGLDLPGDVAGERVEVGIRQKARAVPAVPGKGKEGEEDYDPFLVTWEHEDGNSNPHNWSWTKKWFLVFFLVQLALIVGVAASIDSAAADQAARVFGVSTEVVELQTAVYLVGFGVAAPFLGAFSEIGGRNPVYVVTLLPFILFEIGSALAPNIQTRVILRFWAGFFGSTPLSNSGGSLADVFTPLERTFVFPVFANSGFLGPVLGPTIGGYLGEKLGQEWCDWIVCIYGAAILVAVVALMPETYSPTLLRMKASQVRKATGDKRYKSALEKEREKVPFKKHFKHVMALPFLYLVYEPIVLLTSLYMSMCYILLFGYFEAFPLIFEPFGLNVGEVGLTFISVAIGLCVTTAFTPLVYRRYKRRTERRRQKKREDGQKHWETALAPPEERLITAMILTWLLPIGLFYQAWTSFPTISVWPCISAGVITGAGLLAVFISSYQYIIDVYKAGSATALGALTFTRYLVSGGTVMFTQPMYKSLGNQWALSLLAFLSIPFCFIPWFFFFYGKRIRQWSRFAPASDDE